MTFSDQNQSESSQLHAVTSVEKEEEETNPKSHTYFFSTECHRKS